MQFAHPGTIEAHRTDITNSGLFIDRALSGIREFMEDDGQEFVYHRFIAPSSTTVRFAKALNRSVSGSMNELVRFAECCLIDDDISPHDVGFKLNDLLLSAIAPTKAEGYGKPREAFKAMHIAQPADGDEKP